MIMEAKDMMRVTTTDSRHYIRKDTGEFRPSVTSILSVGYPTSIQLQKYKADHGWAESSRLMHEAAESGSKIHNSIELLLKGEKIATEYLNLKEKRSIQAFIDWYVEERPEILAYEYIIWTDTYAGSIDLKCKLKRDNYTQTWLVDYKSGGIYDTGKAQLMAYKNGDPEATRVAILQLGNTTKKRYTFSEIKLEDESYYWLLFLQSHAMYQLLRPNDKPPEEYPSTFVLPSIN